MANFDSALIGGSAGTQPLPILLQGTGAGGPNPVRLGFEVPDASSIVSLHSLDSRAVGTPVVERQAFVTGDKFDRQVRKGRPARAPVGTRAGAYAPLGWMKPRPDVGRFRSFLVASLENFLRNEWRRRSAQKRGSGKVPVSSDTVDAEARHAAEPREADNPALAYERHWARTVLEQTLCALQQEWERQGRGALSREIQSHLWGDATSVPYAELCVRFDLTPVNLGVTFHRFRQRYRELLRQAGANTVANEAEIEDELRHLMQAVSR